MKIPAKWESIGTVVGDASCGEFTFILRSFKSRIGDIVAVPMQVPNDDYSGRHEIITWGRITTISRFNPFFPYEAAQELANESIPLVDTVLSSSRDQLQAEVLVLGYSYEDVGDSVNLYPLTYPIPPAAEVRYPPAEEIRKLLAGGIEGHSPIAIGTLIARADVTVNVSAERVVARHLAILAMTGGGKTVAARRILRDLIDLKYPVVVFDPHGDYFGLWENRELFPGTEVKLFYPHIVISHDNRRIVETLIGKMTQGLTEPQREVLSFLLETQTPETGATVLDYIRQLIRALDRWGGGASGTGNGSAQPSAQAATRRVVRRSLVLVADQLARMETSNQRLRGILHDLEFEQLPDPEGRPEGIVRPGQVSILYLGGYDHLTQSTIVSIMMEALFGHRAQLSDRIAPFATLVEEAHNFIPSSREGTDETPSLSTLRKVITEGRKFGVGLILVTQRPSRVDETILAQCNSFLVMRLVNPKDQSFVRSVMENLSESDARMLPGFGPGQGIVSGQAVRFPLLVKIRYDEDLLGSRTADENFIQRAREWRPDKRASSRERAAKTASRVEKAATRRRKRNR